MRDVSAIHVQWAMLGIQVADVRGRGVRASRSRRGSIEVLPLNACFALCDAFLVQVLDALNDPNAVMGEGRPHWLAKDWVLEVLHRGDRKKDLVENVERYAHLGIPEYFVYDLENQQVLGYRLSQRGSGRYLRIVPQLGLVPSAVLGLDLAVVGGKLQLFHGMAELFGTGQLLGRLRGMMSDLEVKASEADGRAIQADGRAIQAGSQRPGRSYPQWACSDRTCRVPNRRGSRRSSSPRRRTWPPR
jgi:hypothetical protein